MWLAIETTAERFALSRSTISRLICMTNKRIVQNVQPSKNFIVALSVSVHKNKR